MSSTQSTAHRWDFCRALYLLPSDNKMVCGFVGSFGISLEFENKSYLVDSFGPFQPLLPFDTLA